MSQLREQLRKIMPRLSEEANKLRDPEARSRWMLLNKILIPCLCLLRSFRRLLLQMGASIKEATPSKNPVLKVQKTVPVTR